MGYYQQLQVCKETPDTKKKVLQRGKLSVYYKQGKHMKILKTDNTPFNLDKVPETGDDIQYCVLDTNNNKNRRGQYIKGY